MLSDEECREIWQTSMARCHPMNDISVAGIRTAKAAYALGAERARVVKPLEWSDGHAYAWALGELYIVKWFPDAVVLALYSGIEQIGLFPNIDEAKAACQKHHTEFVLSMLEPV